jgi:UDPglucose 6-dehydrogenase
VCEETGADVVEVARGMGLDNRIGPKFLQAGIGFGGSCFPKDVKALVRTAVECGVPLRVLNSVEEANEAQKRRLFAKLGELLGDVGGRRVALWGLAFKPNTDDMRESPSIPLVEGVLARGGSIAAHDPKAMETARAVFGDRIRYARDPYDAVTGADALAIVTEWLVYRNPDLDRVREALRQPVIVDGRNLFDPDRMAKLGFTYHGIGRRRA